MNKKSFFTKNTKKKENFFLRLKVALSVLLMSGMIFPTSVGYAQSTDPAITLNLSKVTIESFFQAVEKQAGYTFLYRKDMLDNTKTVTVVCTKKPLKSLLDEQLPKLNLNYKFVDKTIVISKNVTQTKNNITGKVIDGAKSPIIGATVTVKGTTNGAITGTKGEFTLKCSPDDELEFSYMGYETIIRKAGTSSSLIITMTEQVMKVDEVVVTGYQKINRKLFTGSASKVIAENTVLKGSGDVSSSLQGKVSGVQISNVSSTFGSSPVMTIRGNSSINGSNKPLWVVDGVVLEDLVNVSAEELTSGNLSTILSSGVAGLNSDDISSFEILKDVSATSLYGAQAMNGVIVITTKQGRKGKLSVNYSGSVAIKERPRYSNYDIMNSADEMSIYKELANKGWIDITTTARAENYGAMGKMFNEITNGTINWGPNGSPNEDFLSKYATSNTDWFNTVFRNSVVNQHSLSVSGGRDKSTFYASLSYYGDSGMAKASDKVDRYTSTLRGNFDISSQVKLGLKLSANVRDQRVPGTKDRNFDPVKGEFKREFDINPFNYALNTSRSMRAYDDNGDTEYFRRSFADFNILHELNNNFIDISVKDISSQADLEYTPHKTLSLRGTFQYRVATTLSEHKIHENSNQANSYRADGSQAIIDANRYLFSNPDKPTSNPYSILPEGGFYNTSEMDLRHTYFRATGDYSPVIGEDHTLNVFAGFEMNIIKRKSRGNDGWGYIWDRGGVIVTHPDLTKYLSSVGSVYYDYSEMNERRVSSFINGAYSYKGKYVFNAGFRYDGSNLLGASKAARYLPSWNVSGAWNMHSEEFMKSVHWINLLKPKASYGFNGIMGPLTSAELSIFANQTLRPTDNEVGNQISTLANDDLTWEKMYEFNLGLEFGILDNRIFGDFAYYNRRSIDLIDYVNTSGIGGEPIKFGNVGNMNSRGFELSVNTVNIRTTNFEWTTNFNVNFHKSKITKLNNFSRFASAVSNVGTPMLGYPQRGLFSLRFANLDAEGIPTFYGDNNELVYDIDFQRRDNIEYVLQYDGPLEPKGYGGLNNRMRFKNWTFSFGFVYKYGSVIRLDDEFYPYYNDYSAFSQSLKNRWIMPGDEDRTNIPAILDKRTYKKVEGKQTYAMYNKSTERVAKGDFIRLKDVTLQYSLPSKWLNKTFIGNASVSFQATNLWLLYSDKRLNGMDPEFFLSGGVSSPISATYTFTLNLSF